MFCYDFQKCVQFHYDYCTLLCCDDSKTCPHFQVRPTIFPSLVLLLVLLPLLLLHQPNWSNFKAQTTCHSISHGSSPRIFDKSVLGKTTVLDKAPLYVLQQWPPLLVMTYTKVKTTPAVTTSTKLVKFQSTCLDFQWQLSSHCLINP